MAGELAYANLSDNRGEYEIIDGKVYMMARPSIKHSEVEYNITNIFKKYLKGKRCRAFNEVDVFLDDDNNFVPDVMIVCNPEIIEDDGIHGAPDLVVEILSKSTARRDRLQKFHIYAKSGVKEYWIVDPINKSVEVYHLIDGVFINDGFYQIFEDWELRKLTAEELADIDLRKEIKVSLYEDFVVDIHDVFEDVD